MISCQKQGRQKMDWRAFYLVNFLIRFSLPAYHTTKRLYMASSFQFYMRKVHPKNAVSIAMCDIASTVL